MKNLYLICNAHIDPVWQWDWKDGLNACIQTFKSVVNLSKKYDFVFAHNESILYEWVEEYDKELFEEIRELIAAGKWKIMGGWYIQPDCNIPAAESLIRQIKVGNEYFSKKFNASCTTAVNFDSFGHTSVLPQILKKCGYNGYMFCRPMSDYSNIPEKFIWQSQDGSEVTATRVSGFYHCPMGMAREKIESELERFENETNVVVLWGVGNHGGGPSEKDLKDIEELVKERSDVNFMHSTPDEYVKAISDEILPIYKGGINPIFPGCYTSQVKVKQEHSKLEYGLYRTEKLIVAAKENCYLDYNAEDIAEAEKSLLFSQFHDIISGTSIKKAMEDSIRRLSHGIYLLEKVEAACLCAIGRTFKKPESDETCIGVFNPFPYQYKGVVEVDFMLPRTASSYKNTEINVVSDGENLSWQSVKEDSNIPINWSKKILVEIAMKPFSAKCLYIQYKPIAERESYSQFCALDKDKTYKIKCGKNWVIFDKNNGCIDSVVNGKGTAIAYKSGYLGLYSDNYDPWGMQKYQHKRLTEYEKTFMLADDKLSMEVSGTEKPLQPVRIVENGDIVTEIESVVHCGLGYAVVKYRFYKNFDYYDIDVTLDNVYASKAVKLLFDVCSKDKFFGGVAAGEEEIVQNGAEHFFTRYIRNKTGSFAVASDSLHGVSILNGKLEITLLRTPVYAGHYINEELSVLKNNRFVDRVDRGNNKFSVRVFISSDGDVASKIERLSREYIEKPVVQAVAPCGNSVDWQGVELVGNSEITLTAMKYTKDGDIILRLYNSLDDIAKTKVVFKGQSIDVDMKGYELKTIIYSKNGLAISAGLEI